MTDDEFKEWESHIFGCGYGTGEVHILPLLKRFFGAIPSEGNYDYQEIEKSIGQEQAWLLFNILLKAHGVFNYGTSPRFGWLDDKGKELKQYLAGKSFEELYEVCLADPASNE